MTASPGAAIRRERGNRIGTVSLELVAGRGFSCISREGNGGEEGLR